MYMSPVWRERKIGIPWPFTKTQSRLSPLAHLHPSCASFDRENLKLAAQSGRHHRDWHATMEVSALALEEFVRKDRYVNVEVACGDAGTPGLTFTSQADATAIVNARRNIDRERALTSQAACSLADRTLSLNNLTMAVTGRTGLLESEQTL